MKGTVPTEDEFSGWLSPPEAMARLDQTWNSDAKQGWILRRLASGEVRAASNGAVIPQQMWKRPWHWHGDLWQTGDVTFFDGPSDIFDRPVPGTRCAKIDTNGLKFDPHGFPPPSAMPAISRPKPGGRPGGFHGEPIANLTLRLHTLSPEELARYTQDAVGAELIEEYRRLKLQPPSVENATRFGGGILRALRN